MRRGSFSQGFDWVLISKHRKTLMGVAIIAIMFCHLDIAQIRNGLPVTLLANRLHLLIAGVDAFMFLSGYGIYYSWNSRKYTYVSFLKKRYARIVPYYLAIGGGTYFLYDIVLEGLGPIIFVKDLLFVTWFENKGTKYWFILVILVFYIVAPVVILFFLNGEHAWMRFVLYFVVWWCATFYVAQHWNWYIVFKMGIERFPIFVMGICAGRQSKENRPLGIGAIVFLVVAGVCSTVLLSRIPFASKIHHYYYLSRGLLALSIILLLTIMLEQMPTGSISVGSIILQGIKWMGESTLEIYLFHQSYMILLGFPPQLLGYLAAAVLFPLVSAAILKHGVYPALRRKKSGKQRQQEVQR